MYLLRERKTALTDYLSLPLSFQVNRAYWVAAKTKMDMQKQVDRRQQLAEAFEKIKSETRVSSLAELLDTYGAEEELNFEMFGAIGELNQEMEELENQKVEQLVKQRKRAEGAGRTAVIRRQRRIGADSGP